MMAVIPSLGATTSKRPGISARPDAARLNSLAFDDIDDLAGLRTHDKVLAAHEDHFIAAPLRIDFDDPGRKRMETDRRRNSRAYRDIEVHIGCFLDPLRLDGGNVLSALLGRRCSGRRGGGVA